jgi:hypothetical protein
VEGRFLSPDPGGHEASYDLYSFCDGDPVNRFDADGRFGKNVGHGIEFGVGDVLANNALDAVLNPIVGAIDPLAAVRYFPGGHDAGLDYGRMYDNGSDVFGFSYAASYVAAELTVQAGMAFATEGAFAVATRGFSLGASATAAEMRMGGTMALRSETAAMRAEATALKGQGNIIQVNFGGGGMSQNFLPYKQGVNYSFDTVKEHLGAGLQGRQAADKGLTRPYLRKDLRATVDAAGRTPDGKWIDANTGEIFEGPKHYGHIYGHEHRRLVKEADAKGMTQKEFNDWVNSHPEWFQIEKPGK